MAKRNQYNKATVPSLSAGQMVVKRLRVTGVAQVSGNLFVQSAGSPEIRLTKSNPGAKMRMRISEGSIDFSSASTFFDAASTLAAKKYSGSVSIPANSRVDCMALYVNTSLSSSTHGLNYIKNIGLTSSAAGANIATAARYNESDYFLDAAASSQSAHQCGVAGDRDVYFPRQGELTGSSVEPATHTRFYTGITGSHATLSFEANSVTLGTGSITYAIYFTQFGPPTSG